MIKVLLADNQVITAEGVLAVLSGIIDIEVTGTARNSAELKSVLNLETDVTLIIDPNYSSRFSLSDLAYLQANFPKLNLMIFTNQQPVDQVLQVTGMGIKNYVSKECSREELIAAIYSTAKGEQFYCKRTFEALFGNRLIPEKEENLPSLSARETELVHLIAEGLTNNEIAERLFLSVHTVKTHRKNIIKKLGFTFKNIAEVASIIKQ